MKNQSLFRQRETFSSPRQHRRVLKAGLLLFFILFLFPRLASAQDRILVCGSVVDAVVVVLIGVGAYISGSGEGTTSDEKDVFTLSVQTARGTLGFSYIGF